MNRSVALRTEPTLRQTAVIIDAVQHELAERGAAVEREGNAALRFRMPAPWGGHHLGVLRAITSGRVAVSAGAGEPWRVRYHLSFAWLRMVTLLLTLVLVVAGFDWPRLTLIQVVAVLWVIVCGIPYAAAAIHFHRLIRVSAREIVERRRRPRLAARAGGTEPPTVPPSGHSPSRTA